ncbi:hypothetical protein BpHYR1_029486 [Brachionus plicatilis]|uniref:Uncharacterized protein n=1 Tax=Brachionus plicatilis TaxID=10195 RepID=A0A3M7S2K3_BRAPC|nr:hypothetical protein BpHYR1_029486 [Brachionus plicatilis]
MEKTDNLQKLNLKDRKLMSAIAAAKVVEFFKAILSYLLEAVFQKYLEFKREHFREGASEARIIFFASIALGADYH